MLIRIAIFGAGGLGREVLQVVRDRQRSGEQVECIGFLVDPDFAGPAMVHGVSVSQDLAGFASDTSVRFIVALGNAAIRARIAARIQDVVGPRFATVIHPSCIIGDTVSIASGSVVLPNTSITTDVSIGEHVLINPHVSISHNCLIEDYVSVGPSATLAGGVYIEQGCEIGAGATITPRQRIGRWSIVGAGTVVIASVAPNTTVVGAPARQVADRPTNWQRAM